MIPPFQRTYEWTSDQWQELWDDIRSAHTEEYYLGSIVVTKQFEGIQIPLAQRVLDRRLRAPRCPSTAAPPGPAYVLVTFRNSAAAARGVTSRCYGHAGMSLMIEN